MAGKTVAAAGMSERTARNWQSGALPSTAKALRTWPHARGSLRRRMAVGGRAAAGDRYRRTAAGADAVHGAVPAAAGALSSRGSLRTLQRRGPRAWRVAVTAREREVYFEPAGNLISCTYVDLRDPVDRPPITTLTKASSKRHGIPSCETIPLSKPSSFLDRGEGLIEFREEGPASGTSRETARTGGPRLI